MTGGEGGALAGKGGSPGAEATLPPSAGPVWELRPRGGAPAVPAPDGVLRLQGEREWIVSGTAEVVAQVSRALPGYAERLGPGTVLLRFGNSVGRLDLPHLGRVEVVSGKWGEEAFDRMLADLVRVAGSLPFSFGVGPLLPVRSSAAEVERVRYHAFLYLRHVLSDSAPQEDQLLPPLEAILREPHRRWRRVTEAVRLGEAGHLDPGALTHLAAGRLHRVGRSGQGGGGGGRLAGAGLRRLADRLAGHLPERIRETRVEFDVDTAENRFVLHFLREAHTLAREVREAGRRRGGVFGARLEGEADACLRKLERVLQANLWREVGEAQHLPLTSTVLQGRRGYREVFRHWVRIRQGARLPLRLEESRRLVEAKDVALLYELWCYFQVVDHLRALLGPPQEAGQMQVSEWEVGVRPEYRVRWPGIELAYNGRFSAGRRGLRRAYSTPLRPDIVLTDRRGGWGGPGGSHGSDGPAVVHILDAKFRVERPSRG